MRRPWSAADGRHRPGWLQETGIVDAVTRQLDRDRSRPLVGDLLVAGPSPQGRTQVGFGPREQAVPDLPVGGEPDPVAGAAEGPGHRGDDADGGRPTVDEEGLGWWGTPDGRIVRGEWVVRRQRAQQFIH